MRQSFVVGVGFILAASLVGCASPDTSDDGDDDAAFAAVPNVPTTAACNGRIHCFARIQMAGESA